MKRHKSEETYTGSSRTIDFNEIIQDVTAGIEETDKRDKDGRIVIPLYSSFFSSLSSNIMCTNAMFESLKQEIVTSISMYSTKERIVLSIYESSNNIGSDIRDGVLIGFKKYINQSKKKAILKTKKYFFSFLSLALLGMLILHIFYNKFPNMLSTWGYKISDIASTVLIWEFVTYLAFEFPKEITNILRLRQISQITFTFKHWE